MTTTTLNRSLKGNQVAEQLRRDIMWGELREGTPLRLSALARKYGVSPTPIREALRGLSQEGLVVTHPFLGASVAPFLSEEILAFARIRIALETEAMTMAFPFHTEASLALVSQNLEQLQATMNLETFMDRQSAFLRSLYEPGGYPFLLEEILKIVTRSQRYAALNAQILKQLPKDVPVPADIVSALKDGNLPLAQARLRRLYESSSALAASILGQQQIAAQTAKRRPRGRPRSVLS